MSHQVDTIIQNLLEKLIAGGPGAVIAALLLVIVAQWFDRKQLHATIQRKDEKIEKIIDDYYKGNLSLTEALTSLRNVLFEIRSRL